MNRVVRRERICVICAVLAVIMVVFKTCSIYRSMASKCEAVERVHDIEACYEAWKDQLPGNHWVSRNFAEDITWIMVDNAIVMKNIGHLLPDIYFEDFGPDFLKPIWKYSSVKDYQKNISCEDTECLAVGDTFLYTLSYQDNEVSTKLTEEIFEGMDSEAIADELLQFSFSYSEDPSVAKINEDGIVTAMKPGKTNLVIVHNGQKFMCPVVVH